MRFLGGIGVVLVVAASARAAGLALISDPRASTQPQPALPTYGRDVAPIINEHCQICHRPSEAAPFSLTTYDEVRARAAAVASAVARRAMPPWKPVEGFGGPFVGERRLSDRQIETLTRWVEQGMERGEVIPPVATATAPPPWRLGTPDVIVTLGDAFLLPASGADAFRNFVVPVPVNGAHYVAGVEFQPSSGAIHHANLRFDRTATARELDAHDPLPGYDGPAGATARYPDGYVLGWTPGQSPAVSSKGMAWRLDAGTDLVLQLHLRPTGRVEHVRPRIAFFFTDEAPAGTPLALRLGKQNIDIAPGAQFVIRDRYTLPVDVDVHSIHPHAHGRATRVRAWADQPDGQRVWLIRIDDWDFNWQDVYRYARPPRVPHGSTIHVEFEYDNSAGNPRNPDRPPRRVLYGQNSSDEMGDVWLQLVTSSPTDRARLVADVVPKALAEDAIGYEMLLRADPHNAALKYGKAATHYNLGSLLASQRKLDEAIAEFKNAIALRPNHSETHNNLGVVLKAMGRIPEAIEAFRRAVAIDPQNRAARENLEATLKER